MEVYQHRPLQYLDERVWVLQEAFNLQILVVQCETAQARLNSLVQYENLNDPREIKEGHLSSSSSRYTQPLEALQNLFPENRPAANLWKILGETLFFWKQETPRIKVFFKELIARLQSETRRNNSI